MGELADQLAKSLVANGPVAALLFLAVWYLVKGNRELVTQINTHINARLKALEDHVDECNQERSELKEKLFSIIEREARKP